MACRHRTPGRAIWNCPPLVRIPTAARRSTTHRRWAPPASNSHATARDPPGSSRAPIGTALDTPARSGMLHVRAWISGPHPSGLPVDPDPIAASSAERVNSSSVDHNHRSPRRYTYPGAHSHPPP